MMKRMNLIWAMLALFSALSFGQKKYEMVIEKTDGTESVFNTKDVARTYFRERNGGGDTSCPDSNHPHLIDFGLPSGTKWACCNVGATKPEEYGGYYAWGETEEKDYYDESTYKYYQNGSYVNLGWGISGTEYDVAHVKWGGKWVMPMFFMLKELIDNSTNEWITLNGVYGCKLTSKYNGNSIFIPAAGYRWYGDLYSVGTFGYYWSDSLDTLHGIVDAYFFQSPTGLGWYYFSCSRAHGHSVRPVQ